MVSYEDVAAAIDWLGDAFAFREEGERFTDGDGRVTHAELSLDGAVVMVGWPGPDYRSPARHAEQCEHARRWLATPWVIDGVHVSVDDVDRHYQRAKDAAARAATAGGRGGRRRRGGCCRPPLPAGEGCRGDDPAGDPRPAVRKALQRGRPRRPPLDVHAARNVVAHIRGSQRVTGAATIFFVSVQATRPFARAPSAPTKRGTRFGGATRWPATSQAKIANWPTYSVMGPLLPG